MDSTIDLGGARKARLLQELNAIDGRGAVAFALCIVAITLAAMLF